MSREERERRVESLKTARGGFSRKGLASIGISWPPKKGWRTRFVNNAMNDRFVDRRARKPEASDDVWHKDIPYDPTPPWEEVDDDAWREPSLKVLMGEGVR